MEQGIDMDRRKSVGVSPKTGINLLLNGKEIEGIKLPLSSLGMNGEPNKKYVALGVPSTKKSQAKNLFGAKGKTDEGIEGFFKKILRSG
jgi:hypothetical protein